jgi:hypothetical protein
MKYKIGFLFFITIGTISSAFARTPLWLRAKDASVYSEMFKDIPGGNLEVQDSSGYVLNRIAIGHYKVYPVVLTLAERKRRVRSNHEYLIVEFFYGVGATPTQNKRTYSV